MQTIYLLSGLGSDEQVFSRLKIEGYKIVYLQWLQPNKNETIQQYAARMLEQVQDENPTIAGLSFGGMMCIEMAKQKPFQKVILISSIPHCNCLPAWMKLAGKLKLNKMLPMKPYKIFQPLEDWNMGVESKEDKELVRHYRRTVDMQYIHWAINVILNWRNQWQPEHLYHIHGGKDRIFPVSKTHPSGIIKDGGHFMVFNRADAVSNMLQEILDN